MKKITLTIRHEDQGKRLDSTISLETGLSRSSIQKLIKQGLIAANSRIRKANYRVKPGDHIEITIPKEPEPELIPEDIPLDIIWEDSHIIVVNKPANMVVHPAAGRRNGTLLNALISKCGKLASTGAPLRPGVVHRLDKDTSGVIVVAKNNTAYLSLIGQFRDREVEKYYLALLHGSLKKDSGEIRAAIGRSVSDRKKMSLRTRKGREAITRFEVIKRFKSATLVKVRLITGRTHQIRVHFSASGFPVLGDRIYGKKTSVRSGRKTITLSRQMLHAYSIKFKHPATGKIRKFTTPMPDDMEKAVAELSEEYD